MVAWLAHLLRCFEIAEFIFSIGKTLLRVNFSIKMQMVIGRVEVVFKITRSSVPASY